MTQARPVGLIAEGSVLGSALARLPGIVERLEPVKASSLRIASRISNGIGGGKPVSSYADLADCAVVALFVPDDRVAPIVSETIAEGLPWGDKTALLCDTWLDSSALAPLARLGAETGSVCLLEAGNLDGLLVEGSRGAITEIKRLFRGDGHRLLIIDPENKPLVAAASTLADALLFPLLSAAEECLKHAQIPSHQAAAFMERATARATRGYAKSRRKAWCGPLAGADRRLMARQFQALNAADPARARFFFDQCRRALEYFECDADWLIETWAETLKRNPQA